MTDSSAEVDLADTAKIDGQQRLLPGAWRVFDQALIWFTKFSLFVIGVLFTSMVTLEVISRYAFSFSIFFVNAAARFLLVWFFLMGAGLALRQGAHVGFEILVTMLSPRRRRVALLVAHALALAFFAEMVWGGLYSLGPAMNQTEPGLEIRLVWAFLAIPIGFALLAYHTAVLMAVELWRPPTDGNRP